MTKNEENNLRKALEKIEPAYNKFRLFVGRVAQELHINPFALMIAFLQASLEQERAWAEECRSKKNEKANDIAIKIAGVLGIKLEDMKCVKIGPEELKKILSVLDDGDAKDIMEALENCGDDDSEDELDF